jgi:predicted HicB family RNase H-like nuclease
MEKDVQIRVPGNIIKESYRKKIHIRLDDDLHHRLRSKVANENTTIQNYIEKLLRNALS